MEKKRKIESRNRMLKVMLIEDDRTMVSLLSTLLKLEGFSVNIPENHHLDGLVNTMLKERPEIALVDVNLRTINGLDLVREIRREPDIKDTPIVMCSGLNLRQQCIQAGADGFILKPFMPDELIKLIHTSINRKEKIKNKEKE
jgi:DNA-binding response OmpR family regulator